MSHCFSNFVVFIIDVIIVTSSIDFKSLKKIHKVLKFNMTLVAYDTMNIDASCLQVLDNRYNLMEYQKQAGGWIQITLWIYRLFPRTLALRNSIPYKIKT